MKITRRKAIELGLMGSGALIFPLGFADAAFAQFSPQIDRFKLPFKRLPELKPLRSDATTDYYEIAMQKAKVEILPELHTDIWSYNGIIPGPTIRQQRDRLSVVRFINNLDIDTSIHLHGMASLPQYDGYASDLIPPGYYKDYHYPNNRASTLWYHDHAVHHTSRNVYMGLAGMYIVEDDVERDLPLPKGEYEVSLILQDKKFTKDGTLIFDDHREKGIYGDVSLVNGVPWPRMEVANRKYRFRVLNGGGSRTYQLSLSTGDDLIVIGSDAGLLSAPVRTKTLRIGMAERYGFIIDFSKYPVGTKVILKNNILLSNLDTDDRTTEIMCFEVTRQETDDSSIPDKLRLVQPIPISSAVKTRTFRFDRGGGQWYINGKTWEPKRVDADPGLNDVEIWNFVNPGGGWIHPVHVHLVDLQMLDRNGMPPLSYERGWKDVFVVGENQTVRVIAQYGPHKGKYMMHCHNIVHEDHDMMTQFEVGKGGDSPLSAPAKPLPAPPL
ncbi:multicopper oxidase family protein [Tumidithrix elongata RA019]|uniref:Multicopper oxidase family protein n=1 Tax=Tumidithrix elongata BACA0141 TaxID=2716417 RepID=A0AAW9Q6N2_9CYAN|nr:multicopper oxidase family protein [Tumidithrix elongata RA019]